MKSIFAAFLLLFALVPPAQTAPLLRLGRGVVNDVAWSPDGALLATASALGVWLHAAADWDAEPRLLDGQGGARSIAFSPDGRSLAAGGEDGSVVLWDSASGAQRLRLTGHLYGVDGIAFSPDGAWLASSDPSGVVRVWDVAAGAERLVLQSAGDQPALRFSPDAALLATGGSETVRLWDLASAAPRFQLDFPGADVRLAFSGDGQQWAVAAETDDGEQLWTLSLAELDAAGCTAAACPVPPPAVVAGDVLEVAFVDAAPLPVYVAAGALYRGDAVLVADFGGALPLKAALSSDGARLATVGAGGDVRVWDAARGVELARLPRYSGAFNRVAFAPEGGALLIEAADGVVLRWDFAADATAPLLAVPPATVWSAGEALSPDGSTRAVGGADSVTRLYDAASGAERGALRGHIRGITSAAFSPDGMLIASASLDATIRVYAVETGETVAVLVGHTRGVTGVVFSPDGRWIASSSYDGTAAIWSAPG